MYVNVMGGNVNSTCIHTGVAGGGITGLFFFLRDGFSMKNDATYFASLGNRASKCFSVTNNASSASETISSNVASNASPTLSLASRFANAFYCRSTRPSRSALMSALPVNSGTRCHFATAPSTKFGSTRRSASVISEISEGNT